MSRPQIMIADFVTEPLDLERQVVGGAAEVVALNCFSEAELAGVIDDADAIILFHCLSITAATLDRLRKCKLIVRSGVGIDNVDHVHARKVGIPVANVPDYGTAEVADTAIGMTLALTRGVHFLNARLRDGQGPWTYAQAAPLRRLAGQVFGIVGLGRIGTASALRAKALNMRVVFYDPYVKDGFDKVLGVERAESLEELLRQVYVLSMHCPATPETTGMISRAAIAQMPRGSYLVNTARGALVDTAAVADALADGRLAGAGIDVLPIEPPCKDDQLVNAWRNPEHPAHYRLILNPHSAFYCEQGLEDMRRKGVQACLNAVTGKPVRNVVN